jgi:hypothetical protein
MYLEEFDTEEEMYQAVIEKYGEDAIGLYHKNLDLLWIWRELGITYTIRREMNEVSG